MIFLKKMHGNMIFSSNVLKNWSFRKNWDGIWSFLYHEERWYFFFLKIWYCFTDGKLKMIFLKKYMEIWSFLYVGKGGISCMLVKAVFLFPTNMKWPFRQKSKDEFFPKNAHKDDISGITGKDGIYPRKDDIGILDWNSRKSSNDSWTFMETFLSVFMYCFPIIIKKQGT